MSKLKKRFDEYFGFPRPFPNKPEPPEPEAYDPTYTGGKAIPPPPPLPTMKELHSEAVNSAMQKAQEELRKVMEAKQVQIENLTRDQLVEAVMQAIQAGDFTTLIRQDGTQKVIYSPYARMRELQDKIFSLEVALKITGVVDYGNMDYDGNLVDLTNFGPLP